MYSADHDGIIDRDSSHDGPYVLRNLLADIPLSEDGSRTDIHITCVDFWNGNLYIGTSAAEILHYVLITANSAAVDRQQTFIPAARLQPAFAEASATSTQYPGVQQILVLPGASKACVLCNSTLTFYSLPELSPTFGTTKLQNCLWVGGVDQNTYDGNEPDGEGVVVMICLKSRIRLVKITKKPERIRDIELAGCLTAIRRSNIACAADNHSYSLLDVVQQQKIPLFDISSFEEQTSSAISNTAVTNAVATSDSLFHEPTVTATLTTAGNPDRPHGRSTSLGNLPFSPGNSDHSRSPHRDSSQGMVSIVNNRLPRRSSSLAPSSKPPDIVVSSASESIGSESSVPSELAKARTVRDQKPRKIHLQLRPNIASPTPNEFLLTTGTSYDDPGVGMFVNLDGEVVRGTLEFSRYPDSLVVDGKGMDLTSALGPGESSEEGFVLAVMGRDFEGTQIKGVEIQRWDVDSSGSGPSKHWLDFGSIALAQKGYTPSLDSACNIGISSAVSSHNVLLPDIVEKLRLKPVNLSTSTAPGEDKELLNRSGQNADREKGEAEFVGRLSSVRSRLLLWVGDKLLWAVRNPLVIRLDAQLHRAMAASRNNPTRFTDRPLVEQVSNELRGQEPQTELQFLSQKYIRQKASVLLFMDLIFQTLSNIMTYERDRRVTEEVLAEGDVDPRVILATLPVLRMEIIQGNDGVWLPGGLQVLLEGFVKAQEFSSAIDPTSVSGGVIFQLTKRYLLIWRRKKGFGSIADEKEVFESVDAALLHLLLLLDSTTPPGPAIKGSVRAELAILMDQGVDCWRRAIELLERFKRLYMLSRLYQSRKMSAKVLATWRRIIEGEQDKGGEFIDGESEMRRYLGKIKDRHVVEEYGTWLATRNPKLGVQIFADDSSRVRFTAKQALDLLKTGAPQAVKDFLQHLVFAKNLSQYANDLIGHYLDSVLDVLETSEDARSSLFDSYESYRALRAPKPAYSHFAEDHETKTDWWRNRLRLLQLLGGSHVAASQYDVEGILSRVRPYEKELVPEMIILNGRQGRHREAIRLLTHGLGDFDTAVSYCVLGGSSTYSPVSGSLPKESIPSREEQVRLFGYLLEEFFCIEDLSDRITQTSELLERFAGWFDVIHVLTLVPNSWSVELISGFLESTFRQLVSERHETAVTRALTSAVNLTANAVLVEKTDALGPTVEALEGIG